MKKKRIFRNQKGFTLIEIIAVLIILGILAAVSVPRYMDITADARDKSAMAAVAEGKARVNMWAAQYILSTGLVPTSGDVDTAALGTSAGDFSLAYTAGDPVVINASGTIGAVSGGTAVGSAYLPTTS